MINSDLEPKKTSRKWQMFVCLLNRKLRLTINDQNKRQNKSFKFLPIVKINNIYQQNSFGDISKNVKSFSEDRCNQ